MTVVSAEPIPPSAQWLGLAGLVPFVAGLFAVMFGSTPAQHLAGERIFLYYAATILAFLGGVRWGAALASPTWRALLLAVAPSLIAFGALLLDPGPALLVFGVTFAVVGAADAGRRSTPLWPDWYRRLRIMLSVGVVTLHGLMGWALHVRSG